jgi:hypothetical protein
MKTVFEFYENWAPRVKNIEARELQLEKLAINKGIPVVCIDQNHQIWKQAESFPRKEHEESMKANVYKKKEQKERPGGEENIKLVSHRYFNTFYILTTKV